MGDVDEPDEVIIRSAGDIFGNQIRLSTGCHACGGIVGGIGLRLGNDRLGCVISWEDFEAAYVALKAVRQTEEFQMFREIQQKRYGVAGTSDTSSDKRSGE